MSATIDYATQHATPFACGDLAQLGITDENRDEFEVTTLAAATMRYRCGRGDCKAMVEFEHPGYTIAFRRDASNVEKQALREAVWLQIVEKWRHLGECRTFTQADLANGEAARWIDALHRGAK